MSEADEAEDMCRSRVAGFGSCRSGTLSDPPGEYKLPRASHDVRLTEDRTAFKSACLLSTYLKLRH